MYQYRQIIVRLRSGDSMRSVARARLADRKTVRRIRDIAKQQGWLDTKNEIPQDEILIKFLGQPKLLSKKRTILPYQSQIETWHSQGIQASTIHATLKREYGFAGSYFIVQRYIKKLKDKSPTITTILEFKPAECAQVDFGAGPNFVNETTGEVIKTWIFVMVLAWSRHMYAEVVLKQDVETWLGCHRRAFNWFNGVPKKIILDNAKCAITKACYYDPVVQRAYADYAAGYGFIISPCPPREPKKKGRVEAGVKYVKNNFIPLRDFRNQIPEANRQLKAWLLDTAGNRQHGTIHEKPLTLFMQTERILLKSLPTNPPECAVWQKVIVHGDCHVTYLKCRYSASYKLAKQELWLRATETTVRLFREYELVAVHPRLFIPGTRSTIEEHLPPNALAYSMKDSQWCLKQAEKIGVNCVAVIQQLLSNSVVDYLRAAQGIVSLQKNYGNARLDAACHRALAFQSVSYKTIKSILQKGLEYAPLPEQDAFDALTETYTGHGRFSRDTSTLLQ